MTTDELQEQVLAALREQGDVQPHLDKIFAGQKGDFTVLVNPGAEEVHVKEGLFQFHSLPGNQVAYHVTEKVAPKAKPQLDHDHDGSPGGSLPKAKRPRK